jgi:hypothetical protein
MQVRYADEKGAFKKIDITLTDVQFERMEKLLPSVPALGEKFQPRAGQGPTSGPRAPEGADGHISSPNPA